jgi:hypothetical protein
MCMTNGGRCYARWFFKDHAEILRQLSQRSNRVDAVGDDFKIGIAPFFVN